MNNPFKYGCVVSGEHFCRRASAERDLCRFIQAGQNVVIQGERRMGKTSLVKKAATGLRGWRMVYIDLYYINNQSDLCRRIVEGVSRSKAELPFLQRVLQMVPRLRPAISFDATDGSPKISIDARAADEPESIDAVMTMLENLSSDGKTCVVFDEFQDIRRLADAERILAEMRSSIQFQENTPYLFLGSVRHELWDIFNNSRSPFFKSAATYDVGAIDQEDFAAFIVDRFRNGARSVNVDTAIKIIDSACGVSGDVQEFCAALWDATEHNAAITEKDFPRALELIFTREHKGFERAASQLTPTQFSVLSTLARTPDARPYGADFLSKVGISNAGTVRKAIKRLETNDLIYEHKGTYRFVDSFFRAWLLAAPTH